MAVRVAVVMSLLAFAICLIVGGLEADNPFATAVWRALLAMGATLVIGLVLGAMAQGMLEENMEAERKKLKKVSPDAPAADR
jgi:predicted Na+-dependent transporter